MAEVSADGVAETLDRGGGAGLVLDGRATGCGAMDVRRLGGGADTGPLGVEPVGREGLVTDLAQIGDGRGLLVVIATGQPEDGVAHGRRLVDERDHGRGGRETLV